MRTINLGFGYVFSLFVLFLLLFIKHVDANHGPGAGGGTITIPAITLKSGAFSLGLNTEFTELEDISNSKLLKKAVEAGSFDAADRTFLYTLDIGYGVTDDFTMGLNIGWFEPINFRSSDDGVSVTHANPEGITDLWLFGKYRFFRGPQGHCAFLAGVKFPTGVTDRKNTAGEELDAVDQPGSGSYDFATGLAYSRWFTKDWTMDTSFKYILRTEGVRDFKVGDRVDWALATAYQIIPRNKYPNFASVGEISIRYLFRDEKNGMDEQNSGGTTVFLSPGVRVGVTPRFGAGTSVSFPVYQNLFGEQQKTDFKASVGVSYGF